MGYTRAQSTRSETAMLSKSKDTSLDCTRVHEAGITVTVDQRATYAFTGLVHTARPHGSWSTLRQVYPWPEVSDWGKQGT